jgi:uncharacterized protein YcfL
MKSNIPAKYRRPATITFTWYDEHGVELYSTTRAGSP